MHELSIALSMIDGVLEEAESRGGIKVEAVHLKLGVLSGVDKAALTFSYDLACEGTALAGSRLVIESVPLVVYCSRCQQQQRSSPQDLVCPVCHEPSADIVTGRELEVSALEIAA